MNILAIDTITPVLAVTATGPRGTVTISVTEGGQHAERLVDTIDRAIGLAGFSPRETEIVACAEGPGSFTGLRLGWSSAKAIQLSAGCPLMPIPTLPTYAAAFTAWPGCVISVLDAKKNRFYAQIFRSGSAVMDALDMTETDVIRYLTLGERILVTGPDANLFAERLSNVVPSADITVIPSGQDGISARLAEFAEKRALAYTSVIADHAGPTYVRKSDAETNTER